MHRRSFLAGMVATAAMPVAAVAQSVNVRQVGVISAGSSQTRAPFRNALREGLEALGWVDGTNIVVEWRYAEGRYEKLPQIAAELAGQQPHVIIAAANVAIEAAKRATSTVPIVMVSALNPLGRGYVDSLARPGGNITGLSWDADPSMSEKYVELLRELIPKLASVGGIINPGHGIEIYRAAFEAAASRSGLVHYHVLVRQPGDLENAFAEMRQRVQAVRVYGSPMILSHIPQIVELAARHRLPTIYTIRNFTLAGGLMSYGTDEVALFRRAASYVDKILKGAKPGDLPVEQPQHFELFINRRTANALGLTIPPSLLLRADRVIE